LLAASPLRIAPARFKAALHRFPRHASSAEIQPAIYYASRRAKGRDGGAVNMTLFSLIAVASRSHAKVQ
jgi:hypothetical protein